MHGSGSGRYAPRRIGRFVVHGELGRGAFGAVLLAQDSHNQRPVAIKILMREDERSLARFEREIEATTRLRHPNLVTLLEAGEHEGRPFLVMDYVKGDTLGALVGRERAISVSRAVELLRDVARGVAYAHSQGVLHRDLKPENVLVDTGGQARVLDFGLAFLGDLDRLSRTGAALGTPLFMAPEQAVGKTPSAQTDVYGLGATLYYALTGRAPLEGEENPLMAVHRVAPPPPSTLNEQIPPALDAIILQALAKTPADRQRSMDALVDHLNAFLSGSAVTVPRPAARRGRLLWAVLALVVLGLVGWSLRPEPPPPAVAPSPTPSGPSAEEQRVAWSAEFRSALVGGASASLLRERIRRLDPEFGTPELVARSLHQASAVAALVRARAMASELVAAPELFEALGKAEELAGDDAFLRSQAAVEVVRAGLHRNRPKKAAEAFARLSGSSREREGRLLLSVLELQGGAVKEGRAGLVELSHTEDRWGLLASAHLASKAHDEGRALDLARRVLVRWPRDAQAQLLEAASLAHLGREGVDKKFASLVGQSETRDDCAVWVAYALHVANQRAQSDSGRRARGYFERAATLCAPRPALQALRGLGLLSILEGRWKDATRALRAQVKLDPADGGSHLLLGVSLDEVDQFTLAIASWREAIRQEPAHVEKVLHTIEPLMLRLRIARAMGVAPPMKTPGMKPETLDLLVNAMTEVPLAARRPMLETGDGLMRGKPWALLKPLSERAVAAAPENGLVVRQHALALMNRGLHAEAAEAFTRTRALGLNKPAVLLAQAENAFHGGEHESTSTLFRELSKGPADDPYTHAAVAFGHYINDRHADVIRLLQPLVKERIPFATSILALSLLARGQRGTAARLLRELFEGVGFSHLWSAELSAGMNLAHTFDRTRKARELSEAFCRELALACVVPKSGEPLKRILEHALLLPRTSALFRPCVHWMSEYLKTFNKDTISPEGIHSSSVLLGLLELRLGATKEKVLNNWRRPPGWDGPPPVVPPAYRRLYRAAFGEEPDLSKPSKPAAPKTDEPKKGS